MTEFIITCESELQKDGSYKIKRYRELVRCRDCKHYVHVRTDAIGHCTKDISCWHFRDMNWYYLPGNIYIGIFYCRNCGGAMIDTDKKHCWFDRAKLWNKRSCADGERK